MRALFISVATALTLLLGSVTTASAQDDQEEEGAAADPAADDTAEPAAADDKADDTAEPAAADDDKADDTAEPAAADGDADHDGTPDSADKDDDNDGTPDDQEQPAADGDADHDGTPDSADKDDDNDGTPDDQEAAAPAIDSLDDDGDGTPDTEDKDDDNDGTPDDQDQDDDGDGVPDDQEAGAADPDEGDDPDEGKILGDDDDDDEEVPYYEYDTDGDGQVEADEAAFEKEYEEAFDDIPDEVTDDALDARPEDAELTPSLTVEDFRKLVRLAKSKVIPRLKAKIEKKMAKKMKKFSLVIFFFSLSGLLLLAMPVVLGKKYPGKGGMLFKYSAMAAMTFVITVNLFGGIVLMMRAVQGATSEYTNPQIAIAGGFFDSLDTHAEEYINTGKELFAPTLEQLTGKGDEQPTVALLENGQKIIEDAQVFIRIAKMFKSIDWVFGILPIVLMIVTLLLFIKAIYPTLMAIVKLPAQAASGELGVGKDVMKQSGKRVLGELIATLCTLGILLVLTLLSSTILGRVVTPALQTFLTYFSRAVEYLQFVSGASSGLVFGMLFSVIFFLVLNIAVFILSMAFFLGKAQKIFQQRFNEGVPLAKHLRFWKWGTVSVVLVQLLPLLFVFIAAFGLNAIEDSLTKGITDAESIGWGKLMLCGPLFLVVGFLVLFWAARGLKAIKFLATYKVVEKPPEKQPVV